MKEFAEALQGRIEGEVRFDPMTRHLYSTDASMFQVEPLGVVVPRHLEDVHAAMELAARHGVSVVGRGGGTALAGQSIGEGLVFDFSTHLNKIEELNTEEGWVRVQPGVVQDQLNAYLARHGYGFGPDTATSNRATLGGMAGNNSAGKGSVIYGKTVDHVIAADVVLSDGTPATFGPLDESGLEARLRGEGLQARIYREVLRIARDHAEEVEARFPKILRRVSGYNLDEMLKSPAPNLASLLVGSEGTLALITGLKLRIVPLPAARGVMAVHYHDMIQAVEGNEAILAHGPSAMELVDRRIIHEAMRSPDFRGQTDFLEGDPESILIVEFHGDSTAEVQSKLDGLEADLRRQGLGYAYVKATDPAQQNTIWKLRKAGLGLLMGTRIDPKPVAFVEDTAVDPLKLSGFLREFKRIVDKHGTDAGYYGHASVGCLHIRPFIDLRAPGELEKMMAIFEEVAGLVAEYGGTVSGEHGDGLARSWLIERFFGSRLYDAFREVKRAWDPHNLMNPGKIVDGPRPTRELLRLGQFPEPQKLETALDFSRDGGFEFAVEMCNGNGQCRKMYGTMCPSYQATLNDRHSTRGRANALRGFISGKLGADALTSEAMHEVMDLCLECKACATECPSNVDMAKMKYEFLHHYHARHGTPLRDRLFGHVEWMNRLGCATAPLSNWAMRNPLARLGQSLLGVAPQRSLPPFAGQRFSRWFGRRAGAGEDFEGAGRDDRPPVVLFHDTFMEYNYPSLGQAAVKVLEGLGYRVVLPDKKCCGRPLISKGLLEPAKAYAGHNLAALRAYAERGIPIVGVEPSCILTLREDYRDLMPGSDADRVAGQVTTIDEFLAAEHAAGRLRFADGAGEGRKALLHGHCHQKSLVGTGPTLSVLRAIPGMEAEEIASGCCGMAGSFGYEKDKYAVSMRVGELQLMPAVRSAAPGTMLVADGISCRQQIQHATGGQARHLVEVVAEHMA